MRGRIHHRTAVPVALALAGLLTGCGGVREQTVGDDGLRFFVHGRTVLPSGGMDAEVVGALDTADGCVLLERDGTRFPVVWPRGTSVADADPLVIELPSGQPVHVGDRISGAGGYTKARDLNIDVPYDCLNEFGEVAVFNRDDDPVPTP